MIFFRLCTIPVSNAGITGSCRAGSRMNQSRRRIRISRKHTARNHHGAQKRAKRTDSRHGGFIISADPLRDFRNDYVAILHPAPYDLVYLIHNFNPILSLLQKCFLRCIKRQPFLFLFSLRYFLPEKLPAHVFPETAALGCLFILCSVLCIRKSCFRSKHENHFTPCLKFFQP